METNLVNALLTALTQQKAAVVAPAHDLVLIVTIIAASLSSTLASFAAFIQSRANAVKNEATVKIATETAAVIEKVHVAVNSGQTAAVEKFDTKMDELDKRLATLLDENKRLATELATALQKERGAEVAKAQAAGPVALPSPPPPPGMFPALSPEQIAQIKAAIT